MKAMPIGNIDDKCCSCIRLISCEKLFMRINRHTNICTHMHTDIMDIIGIYKKQTVYQPAANIGTPGLITLSLTNNYYCNG